jgi:hypothetical protein
MNTETTPINPVQQVVTNTITSFSVSILSIEIFKSAQLGVKLYDVNNNFINMVSLTISGTEYNKWGSDDNYLIEYVANYYGYTIISDINIEIADNALLS